MNDHLIRTNLKAEFPTRERVHITQRLNDPAAPTLSLADARVEPGVTTELHSLDVDEWYVIQLGTGLMEVFFMGSSTSPTSTKRVPRYFS